MEMDLFYADIAPQVLRICGYHKSLDIHFGQSRLAKALAAHGVEAHQGLINKELSLSLIGEKYGTVIFLEAHRIASREKVAVFLGNIRNVAEDNVVLRIKSGQRNLWEEVCIEAGFAKHPQGYACLDQSAFNNPDAFLLLSFKTQKNIKTKEATFNVLRGHGTKADHDIFRYSLASGFIRRGERVGLLGSLKGWESDFLSSNSVGKSYVELGGASDRVANDLASLCDFSYDCMIQLDRPVTEASDIRRNCRVLSPGGRWIFLAEPGVLKMLLLQDYPVGVERAYAISADLHRLPWKQDVDLEKHELSGELFLCVVMKSPLDESSRAPYVETYFSSAEVSAGGNSTSFARDYVNPWLVKAIVSRGQRVGRTGLLKSWGEKALEKSPAGSADEGASLCILCYQMQEGGQFDLHSDLVLRAQSYIKAKAENPTALRWQVSLASVLATGCMRSGLREDAQKYFQQVLDLPVEHYHPSLMMKVVDAAWNLGLIALGDENHEEAKRFWIGTGTQVLKTLGEYWGEKVNPEAPLFEVRELSDVVAYASRLLAAAKNVDMLKRYPGHFSDEIRFDSLAKAVTLEQVGQAALWFQGETQRLQQELDASKKMNKVGFVEKMIQIASWPDKAVKKLTRGKKYEKNG